MKLTETEWKLMHHIQDEWYNHVATQGYPCYWRRDSPVGMSSKLKTEMLCRLRGFCRGLIVAGEWIHLDHQLSDSARYSFWDAVDEFEKTEAAIIDGLLS